MLPGSLCRKNTRCFFCIFYMICVGFWLVVLSTVNKCISAGIEFVPTAGKAAVFLSAMCCSAHVVLRPLERHRRLSATACDFLTLHTSKHERMYNTTILPFGGVCPGITKTVGEKRDAEHLTNITGFDLH